MANPYSIFLMSQLAVAYDIIDKDEDYDTMWAEAQTLLQQFEESKFNKDLKSEIDCMVDFCIDFKNSMLKPEETKLGLVADRIVTELHGFALDYNYKQFDVNMALPMEKDKTMCDIVVKELKRHIVSDMLKFINDEDNHTEGEQGNSCIDVNTLIYYANGL